MESGRALFVFGTWLLAIAALLGFVQKRHRDVPEEFARWRVVHAGGTAGAVQLLALSAIWPRLSGSHPWTTVLAWGLILVAWAFLLGPTAQAVGPVTRPRLMRNGFHFARWCVWGVLAVAAHTPEVHAATDPFAGCRQQFADKPHEYDAAYCFTAVAQQQRLWDDASRALTAL